MMKFSTPVALFLCMLISGGSFADETDSSTGLSEFKQLQENFQQLQEEFYQQRRESPESEHQKLYETVYPGNTMSEEFLTLEEKYRGTLVGLSCLHHLVSLGGGNSTSELSSSTGKRDAMIRLRDYYHTHHDLDVILRWVPSGAFYEKESADLFSRAAESPHKHVRAASAFYRGVLLKECSKISQSHRLLRTLLTEADSELPLYQFLDRVEPVYRGINVATSQQIALELIEVVLRNYADVPLAPRSGYGPILLEVDRNDKSNSTPGDSDTYGQRAARMQYDLLHLDIGQTVPDIESDDAFGKPLKLFDHRGKVIVLFFSFKGCGPCEEMYPDNRKLIEELTERPFAFLGVMGDEQIETVRESVTSGKITWPVWWTGPNRELANQWNVSSWPTIFVIDHTGKIRYKGLRGELLRRAVHKLVKEAETAQPAELP